MATNIATLAVKFVADTTGLKTGTTQATGILGKFGLSASAASGVMAGLAAATAAVGAASYIAYKGIEQFAASAARIDKTSKLAERLDLTYGSLQKLTYIAGQSDIEVGALAKAMEHMGRSMGSGGMSLENRFAEQAKRIGAIKDPALRAAAAFKTFGKAGGELIPLMHAFAQDAAKFDRFGGKFGFGIEDKDARNVERMNDAWSDLVFIGTQLADKFVSKFGGPVATFLENVIEMSMDWADTLGSIGVTWDNVGGFAVSLLTEVNGLLALQNGMWKSQLGMLLEIQGIHQLAFAKLSGDKLGAAEGAGKAARGRGLFSEGTLDIGDVLSGKTGRDFQDAIANGSDFSKRNRFGGDGGGFGAGPSMPRALEFGSSAAVSAIQGQGGNPMTAVAKTTQKQLEALEDILDIQRKLFYEKSTPVPAAF